METHDATRVAACASDAGGLLDEIVIVHAPSLEPFQHIVRWLLRGGLLAPRAPAPTPTCTIGFQALSDDNGTHCITGRQRLEPQFGLLMSAYAYGYVKEEP